MLTTLFLGALPACLGVAVLALPVGTAGLGFLRAVAVGAALAVVGAELLPAGVDALGVGGLAVAAAGFLLPLWFDNRVRHPVDGHALGLGALMAHQLSDGLQAGVARPLGPGVVLALAAHGAPLVAAATLASARVQGRAAALTQGGLLVGATSVGILASGAVDAAWLTRVEPVLGVALAGLLVHAVTEGLAEEAPPTGAGRALETVGFLAGLAGTLALVGGGHHGGAHLDCAHRSFTEALALLAGASGLALTIGLGVGQIAGTRARSSVEGAVLGALLGGWGLGLAGGIAGALAAPPKPSPEPRVPPELVLGLLLAALLTGFVHLQHGTGLMVLGLGLVLVSPWSELPIVAVLPVGAALSGLAPYDPPPGFAGLLPALILVSLHREGPRAWLAHLFPHAHRNHEPA